MSLHKICFYAKVSSIPNNLLPNILANVLGCQKQKKI